MNALPPRIVRCTSVSAILERHGIDRRYNLLSTEQIARAAELYGESWPFAKVGSHSVRNNRAILR
jgi:type IV secretory pathway TrbF-like protein